MSSHTYTPRLVMLGLMASALAILTSQCSDTVAPAPPSRISIESGDAQYSRRGTTLPDPLVVRVLTNDGVVPEVAHVVFTVVNGGGTLSRTSAGVDGRGRASTRYTLGGGLGTNVVRATIKENPSKFVEFWAKSANFYCPEQADTFVKNLGYGSEHDVFLVTRKSSLYKNPASAGVVEIDALPPYSTRGFAEITGSLIYETNVFDAAFSERGDFYVARRSSRSEILKISPSGEATFFAHLDETPEAGLFAEIATNPSGLLVGCDGKGPFVVGCGDSLIRFPEATFIDGNVNNDAVAVDPRRQWQDRLGEDIYFIDKTSSELKRLALDSLTVEPLRGLEKVASLSKYEAASARGMACELSQGNVYIYILVDSTAVKELLQVTLDGTVTILYDFFERGEGDAAGIQRDLAFDEGRRWLYTLDTLNDNLLLYDIQQDFLLPMFDDSLMQTTLSNRHPNGELIGAERVGLAVIR